MPAIPPTYREIADELTRRIKAGQYKPGTMLPSYSKLADEFEVSVSTIQQALRILRERGLTTGRPGRGVYVK